MQPERQSKNGSFSSSSKGVGGARCQKIEWTAGAGIKNLTPTRHRDTSMTPVTYVIAHEFGRFE
jgi:hypothetical protein